MPSTFVSLVLFVAFLSPGIVFFLVREARRPQRELSAFRETAVVVLMGVACNALILAILFVIRAVLDPTWLPDPWMLLAHPGGYFRLHTEAIVFLAAGIVAAGCLAAVFLGYQAPPSVGSIRFESAWYKVFHDVELIYCGCALEDGSWIGGYLKSFNTDVEESADRELVLSRPRYRAPGEGTVVDLGASLVIISARRLMRIDVGIMKPPVRGEASTASHS